MAPTLLASATARMMVWPSDSGQAKVEIFKSDLLYFFKEHPSRNNIFTDQSL